MEIWDAYNKHLIKQNTDLVRGQPITDGLYHIVAEVIVRHVDGDYLAMQRAYTKSKYPGAFEISAGGSILKGETPLEGITRELLEETGILCYDFKQIYTEVNDSQHTIYIGYSCNVNCDKNSIKLQDGETISYKWIKHDKALDFIKSNDYVTIHRKRIEPYIYRNELENYLNKEVTVFVDRPLGSVHPKHSDIIYPVNYGYINELIAPDSEQQDAYILGVSVPLKTFSGKVAAIIRRNNDIEDKLVIIPHNASISKSEIIEKTNFQEQYFDIQIII